MDHPSHPHQLQRSFDRMTSRCKACGNENSGTFYHCTSCSWFKIHLDCALLPAKLLIQQSTNESFRHSHLSNLVYSFPYIEQKAKFFPKCRVCDKNFPDTNIWHYRCNKCRYYVHIDCATSRKEAFMCCILMPAGQGKTHINFKVEDHPNLIRYPFPDESVNLVMHHFINKGEKTIKEKIVGEMFSHRHPLILVDTLLNGSISLHDPMKKVELLCDGCVRPITDVPFYKCCQQDCGFVLHERCTRLPSEIQHHPCHHPEHKLVLCQRSLKICWVCFGVRFVSYIAMVSHMDARNVNIIMWISIVGSYLMIRHKYDNHPLSLRYYPAENHSEEYFCEICEVELNPERWFYHCSGCALSMLT
ncbi:hypothetical protein M8C21_008199, partial [Ambrosia artemisiifolia]